MADDGFRLRDLCNAISDLITSIKPADRQVIVLGDRVGVAPINTEDTDYRVHQLVQAASRDDRLWQRLLQQIPKVFTELAEPLAKLTAEYASAAAGPPRQSGGESRDERREGSELGADILSQVRSIAQLRAKFREVLLGETLLDRSHVADLHDELLAALSQLSTGRQLMAATARQRPAAIRRQLSMLDRVENAVEACMDAAIYFVQVSDAIEDASRTSSGVGVTEADRATADLVRLRELNHCREQIRSRLRRLSEECERLVAETSWAAATNSSPH